MDRINGLSDDLLVKILLFLPTNVAVSTSILSKRWDHLWMWLPKLEFVDDSYYSEPKCKILRCFLDRNLPLHKAAIIERLRLKFSELHFKSEVVKLWIAIAVSRHVRELDISYFSYENNPNILPSSLYTCKSLGILKLNGNILLDVPQLACLPSLKTLQLRDVVYYDEESIQRLLFICPILEDLLVDFCYANVDEMRKFTIIVPSLQSLSLFIPGNYFDLVGFVLNTPSLKYFTLQDRREIHSCLIENMPKLREAYVDVDKLFDIKSLIRSITSAKSLTLRLKSNGLKAVCDDGFFFSQLEHLKLCVCQDFNVLVRFLEHFPNLQELELLGIDEHCLGVGPWNEPTMVPECILSNLQILNWSQYFGTPEERDFAVYILKNARRLKKATFSSDDDCVPKLKLLKELAFSSRASTMCQLAFEL